MRIRRKGDLSRLDRTLRRIVRQYIDSIRSDTYACHQLPIGTGSVSKRECSMAARLRHLGIAVRDPKKTMEFYVKAFGMKKIGEIHPDHVGASGYYVTDGTMNIAIVKFKTDEYAGEDFGKDFVGLHHIGFEVDDQTDSRSTIEGAGGSFMWEGGLDHKKYRDVDGLIFETSAAGFATEEAKVSQTNTGGGPKVAA
jgi:catechol 2,3-dioxygenase-like lactoylglutathione lyase family enzyme